MIYDFDTSIKNRSIFQKILSYILEDIQQLCQKFTKSSGMLILKNPIFFG